MDKKYDDAMNFLEKDTILSEKMVEAINKAGGKGFSYEEIYTALHKMVDLNLYEWEIDNFL